MRKSNSSVSENTQVTETRKSISLGISESNFNKDEKKVFFLKVFRGFIILK